jgi:hypothetical protein
LSGDASYSAIDEGTFHRKWFTRSSIPDWSATPTTYPDGARMLRRSASVGFGLPGVMRGRFWQLYSSPESRPVVSAPQ